MSTPTLLILAISGRALAQAARRAGFTPLVADFFCDRDTREAASACVRVAGDIAQGFTRDAVLVALEQIAADAASPPAGLVYGAGLENQPALLEGFAARWPVIGNDAETVRRIKDPRSFFGTLDELDIRYPEVRLETERVTASSECAWLLKRIGGAGGSHIKRLSPSAEIPIHSYAQRLVEGRSISALILSDSSGTRMLGFSEQWRAPAPDRPFRYGGAVQPADLSPREAQRIAEIASAIGEAFELRGLGSVDFILTEDGPLVLEVNPRPGATLDIFDDDEMPLLAVHLGAFGIEAGADCDTSPRWGEGAGRSRPAGEGERLFAYLDQLTPLTPSLSPTGRGGSGPAGTATVDTQLARASQIVFAPRDLTIPAGMAWPEWTADRPHDGETLLQQRPVCTVHAAAETPAAARELAVKRESAILESIEAVQAARVQGG